MRMNKEESPNNQDKNFILAEQVGQNLLKDFGRYNLSVYDLRQFGLLTEDQTFSQFMYEQLRIGESIYPVAVNHLLSYLPEISSQSAANELLGVPLARADEDNLRTEALENSDSTLTDFYEEAEMMAFNWLVILATEKSGERDELIQVLKDKPLAMFEVIVPEPVFLSLLGKVCFGIEKMATLEEKTDFERMYGVEGQQTGDVFIVKDQAANMQLSVHILKNRPLRSYYLAKEIVAIQHDILDKLTEEFRAIALIKHQAVENEVIQLNQPLVMHWFKLLKQAAFNKTIELVTVARDGHDLGVMRGEFKAKEDRSNSDSKINFYTLYSDGRHILFNWEDGADNQQVMARYNRTLQCFEYQTYIRNLNAETLDQRWKIDVKWEPADKYALSPVHQVDDILVGIRPISLASRLEHGEAVNLEISKITQPLLNCTSATEFCQTLRKLGLNGAPAKEMIVNTNADFLVTVDER